MRTCFVLMFLLGAATPAAAQTVPDPPAIGDPADDGPDAPRHADPSLVTRPSDAWEVLLRERVTVYLADGRVLSGELVRADGETLVIVEAGSGDLVSVRKLGVVRFSRTAPPPAWRGGHESRVVRLVEGLERGGRRRFNSGLSMMIAGGVLTTLCFVTLGTAFSARGNVEDGLFITSTISGPFAALHFIIGAPILAAGVAELKLVKPFRDLKVSALPTVTPLPGGGAAMGGTASVGFSF